MIARMQDGILGQSPFKPTDPPKLQQFLWKHNHLKLSWGILYSKILQKELQEAQFQFILLATHRGTFLRRCHDEVDHLDLEWMLNLMCNHFFWPQMAIQVKKTCWEVPSVCHLQGKAIAGSHGEYYGYPLELVHTDYLCLEPGKVKEENVLLMTYHFTCYAQAYIIQSQMA